MAYLQLQDGRKLYYEEEGAGKPVVFIHGESDDFVPCEMSERLFDACASEKKRLIKVENADHGLAYSADKEYYLSTLRAFIAENFEP